MLSACLDDHVSHQNLPKFNKIDKCVSDVALVFKIDSEVEEVICAFVRGVNAFDQHLLLKERDVSQPLKMIFVVFKHRIRNSFLPAYTNMETNHWLK